MTQASVRGPRERAEHGKAAGVVAFVIAVTILVAAVIAMGLITIRMSELVPLLKGDPGSLGSLPADQQSALLDLQSQLTTFLGIGTLLGLWAIVQGIVATVRRRGRAFGIAAIAIAVVAPVICLIAYVAIVLALAPSPS